MLLNFHKKHKITVKVSTKQKTVHSNSTVSQNDTVLIWNIYLYSDVIISDLMQKSLQNKTLCNQTLINYVSLTETFSAKFDQTQNTSKSKKFYNLYWVQ